jgi:hypothetical protein
MAETTVVVSRPLFETPIRRLGKRSDPYREIPMHFQTVWRARFGGSALLLVGALNCGDADSMEAAPDLAAGEAQNTRYTGGLAGEWTGGSALFSTLTFESEQRTSTGASGEFSGVQLARCSRATPCRQDISGSYTVIGSRLALFTYDGPSVEPNYTFRLASNRLYVTRTSDRRTDTLRRSAAR